MNAKVETRMVNKSVATMTVETRDDSKKMLVGYGAVFHRDSDPGTQYCLWGDVYERIDPHAFDRAINEKHDARGLFNHNPDYLLGRVANNTMRLSIDSTGLRYEIDLDENDPDHQRVLAKVVRGDLTGSSFSFVPTKVEWSQVDETSELRVIKDLDLYDTGPVTYPAYEGTSVSSRHEQWLGEARSEDSYRTWKANHMTTTEQNTEADKAARDAEAAAAEAQAAEAAKVAEAEAAKAAEVAAAAEAAKVAEAEAAAAKEAEATAAAEAERATFTSELEMKERQLAASLWS